MMNEIIKITSYFVIYSLVGWILESAYKTCLFKKFVNSGFLFGPFCPIYGFGALIMYLFTGLKGKYALLFITAFVILSVWEYLVGIMLEKLFKTKYWDYSEDKFNFQGRLCLKNSIFWGILAIIFVEIANPITVRLIEKVPENILSYITIILSFYIITDIILSIIKLNNINIRLDILTEIKEDLKQLEIKERLDKLEQQIKKLRMRFPTMRSERLTKWLERIKNESNFRH